MKTDICIIGGGAAGLAAAITAGKAYGNPSVTVLEKNNAPARKVRATGNGRCNLGNSSCDDFAEVCKFFSHIGVLVKTKDEGRAYPYSEEALAVTGALIDASKNEGVEMICSAAVQKVTRENDGTFLVQYETKEKNKRRSINTITAKSVILSCGGKAAPQFGTTGDGYRIAKSLGHTVTKLAPALTPVETVEDMKGVSGVRQKSIVKLLRNEEVVASEEGEVQFTDYGVSGIAVFNMSRLMKIPDGKSIKDGFSCYELSFDLTPECEEDELRILLSKRIKGPDFLYSLVKKKLADMIRSMSGGDIDKEIELLKNFTVHPSGLKGWKFCEITSGGIPTDEVDGDCQSKVTQGLFIAGEILDKEGPCGGFNLENAWITGMAAGSGAAEYVANYREH